MRKNLIVLAAVVLLVGISLYNHISAQHEQVVLPAETAPQPDYLAPPFSLAGLDGEIYEVGGSRDKPILLNFWASWCGPCELEAPDLKKMYDKYKDELDLYGVNLSQSDKLDNVKEFVNRHELLFPILLDKEGKINALYKFHFIPTTFLIDRHGIVVEVFNMVEPKELEKKIKRLISR